MGSAIRLWYIGISMIVLLPSTAMAQARAPELLNVGEVVTPRDYPAEAANEDLEGLVSVVVGVDRDGKVADCRIGHSSGIPSLDTQTCRLIWLRARFAPGRDQQGKAGPSVYHRTFTWRLEEPALPNETRALPNEAWAVRSLVEVARGREPRCKMELEGQSQEVASYYSNICSDSLEQMTEFPPPPPEPGQLQTYVFEERFIPGRVEAAAVPQTGQTVIGRQMLYLEIDERGEVSSCTLGPESGTMPGDPKACAKYRARFRPRVGKNGVTAPFVATVTMTFAVRTRTQT